MTRRPISTLLITLFAMPALVSIAERGDIRGPTRIRRTRVARSPLSPYAPLLALLAHTYRGH